MAGTRWVKLDTSYLRNPKITALHPQALLLHLASILWTADQLQDGHIPAERYMSWGIRQASTEHGPLEERSSWWNIGCGCRTGTAGTSTTSK